MEDISGYDPFGIREKQIQNGELLLSELEKIGHKENKESKIFKASSHEDNNEIDEESINSRDEDNSKNNNNSIKNSNSLIFKNDISEINDFFLLPQNKDYLNSEIKKENQNNKINKINSLNFDLYNLNRLEYTPEDLKNDTIPVISDSDFMEKLNDFLNENEYSKISSNSFENICDNLKEKNFFNSYDEVEINNVITKKFKSNNIELNKLKFISNKYIGNFFPSKFENNVFYRYVLNDGDSFIRCIIYSLLENYIKNSKKNEINKIIYDIIKLNLNNFKIEKEKKKLECILKMFENLINIFNIQTLDLYFNNELFNNVLIKYSKYKIYHYLKNIFIGDIYLKNEIFKLKNSLPPELLYYIPLIFDINLNLIFFNSKNKKKTIIFNLDKTKHTINLVYFNHSFKLRYSNLEDKNNLKKEINFEQNSEYNLIINKENINCEICSKTSDLITLKNFSFQVCKYCLIKNLKGVISKKINNLIKNNFNNCEYFLQSILLDPINRLDEDDFYILFEHKNIFEIMKEILLKKKCKKCNKQISKKKDFNILYCNNLYCSECIENEIINNTRGFKFLNNFEKIILFDKIKKTKCICEENFHLQNSINLFYDSKEIKILKNESEERKKNYFNNFCINCGGFFEDNNLDSKMLEIIEEIQLKKLKKKINIKINNDSDENEKPNEINKCSHYLCENCIGNLNEMANLRKKNKIEKKIEIFPIKCILCEKIHFIDYYNLKKNEIYCKICILF